MALLKPASILLLSLAVGSSCQPCVQEGSGGFRLEGGGSLCEGEELRETSQYLLWLYLHTLIMHHFIVPVT